MPTAKLVNGKAYSIISDHLGTPILAVDSEGNEVWNRQLDIYGRVKKEIKASSLGDDVRPFIPFLYQGQYYDFETGLCYNRFRYYSPETGAYISQDPIGLAGGNPTLYGYVKDSNWWVDVFGLVRGSNRLRANNDAVGSHSSFERDFNGNIFKYETYEMVSNDKGDKFFNPVKRFDGGRKDGTEGVSHRDSNGVPIPTPHVNLKGGDVRVPEDDEFPNNERFRNNNNGCNG